MCVHVLGWVSRGAKIKRVKSRKRGGRWNCWILPFENSTAGYCAVVVGKLRIGV